MTRVNNHLQTKKPKKKKSKLPKTEEGAPADAPATQVDSSAPATADATTTGVEEKSPATRRILHASVEEGEDD